MAKYAIIENQTITNTVVWDGDTNKWSPPDGSIAVLLDTPSSIGIGDSYIGGEFVKVDVYTITERWENLRLIRDGLLRQSDWTQLPDIPAEIKTPYQTYRQELRDLPANTTDPRNAPWPEKPN